MISCKNWGMNQRVRLGPLLALALLTSAVCAAAGDAALPRGTRITLQLNHTLGTRSSGEGDPFTAVVTTSVYRQGRIAIPKGSVVGGSVARVLRPGRLKGKALLDLEFQSISIPGRGEREIVATLLRIDAEGGANRAGTEKANRALPAGGAGDDARRDGARRDGALSVGEQGSVFSSQGRDLEIPRGSTLDILLERPLPIPGE